MVSEAVVLYLEQKGVTKIRMKNRAGAKNKSCNTEKQQIFRLQHWGQ